MHVDGYQGYNNLPGITLVGCWAHARRKFDEALKALPKEKQNAAVAARKGLDFCNRLFALERELKNLSAEERYHQRLKRGKPIIDEFKKWLDYQKPRVPLKIIIWA
jgi:transposase